VQAKSTMQHSHSEWVAGERLCAEPIPRASPSALTTNKALAQQGETLDADLSLKVALFRNKDAQGLRLELANGVLVA
jgi:hypothetical protein